MSLGLLGALLAASTATGGCIRVQLEGPFTPLAAQAIERRVTPTGIQMHPKPGRVEGTRIVFEDLREGVAYDLRIETDAGLIQGWDSRVPPSDYEPEQPLSDDDRTAIFAKIEKMERKAFYDDVAVLDIAGNLQNAAVLVYKFHRRGFVEAEDRGPDLVWRVDRLQYENPEEQSWVPHGKLAFYALERHRVTRSQAEALRVLMDRRLGGITPTADRADVDLGTLRLPAPPPGVHACDEEGRILAPIRLKPDPQIPVTH